MVIRRRKGTNQVLIENDGEQFNHVTRHQWVMRIAILGCDADKGRDRQVTRDDPDIVYP